ncbi:hypothetical protein B0H14DRAFT_3142268 [Mycena olivaceomarginata]|nr:hypothetical protein B0H14DRAFT_3142268 [Mycena olivaceomarginata]
MPLTCLSSRPSMLRSLLRFRADVVAVSWPFLRFSSAFFVSHVGLAGTGARELNTEIAMGDRVVGGPKTGSTYTYTHPYSVHRVKCIWDLPASCDPSQVHNDWLAQLPARSPSGALDVHSSQVRNRAGIPFPAPTHTYSAEFDSRRSLRRAEEDLGGCCDLTTWAERQEEKSASGKHPVPTQVL